jgi:hypothetical protein
VYEKAPKTTNKEKASPVRKKSILLFLTSGFGYFLTSM